MRKLLLFLFICSTISVNAQVPFGITAGIQVSQIFNPARDSFISDASWGAGLLTEHRIANWLTLSFNPGYRQINYKDLSGNNTFKCRTVTMPVYFSLESKGMKKLKPVAGVAFSGMLSKKVTGLSGVNPGGVTTTVIKETSSLSTSIYAGLNIQLSPGYHIQLAQTLPLKERYFVDNIAKFPAHVEATVQLRFAEMQKQKKETDTLNQLSYSPEIVVVLLPTDAEVLKRYYFNTLTLSEWQQMIVSAFQGYCKLPVVFVADSLSQQLQMENLPMLNASGIDVNFEKMNSYVLVKAGTYFLEGSRSEIDGLFLMNSNFEVVLKPFLGFYKLHVATLYQTETVKADLNKAVIKLNDDLLKYTRP